MEFWSSGIHPFSSPLPSPKIEKTNLNSFLSKKQERRRLTVEEGKEICFYRRGYKLYRIMMISL